MYKRQRKKIKVCKPKFKIEMQTLLIQIVLQMAMQAIKTRILIQILNQAIQQIIMLVQMNTIRDNMHQNL